MAQVVESWLSGFSGRMKEFEDTMLVAGKYIHGVTHNPSVVEAIYGIQEAIIYDPESKSSKMVIGMLVLVTLIFAIVTYCKVFGKARADSDRDSGKSESTSSSRWSRSSRRAVAHSSWRCITSSNGHNIRAHPRMDAGIVGSIRQDDIVFGHLIQEGDWLQLSDGFALMRQESKMFFADATVAQSSWRCTTTGIKHYIRAHPRRDADIVGSIQRDDIVTGHLIENGSWLQLPDGFTLFRQESTMFFADA